MGGPGTLTWRGAGPGKRLCWVLVEDAAWQDDAPSHPPACQPQAPLFLASLAPLPTSARLRRPCAPQTSGTSGMTSETNCQPGSRST